MPNYRRPGAEEMRFANSGESLSARHVGERPEADNSPVREFHAGPQQADEQSVEDERVDPINS